MMASLSGKRTDEMTEEELDILHQLYISSKTVNGKFCPTPEPYDHDDYDYPVETVVRGEVSDEG